ncbi:N-acetylmuramoyl-L-alanine amidase AmiC [Candidatus Magnetaquicoccaceae bacterium FCR-1]|uniref:N-acetylmuramoyl-L-alanine amidase n=1 Tax=Candidatus Magnetaquiglobus chichijimensis TaxID=3141448 RepID=A0ABQ0C8I3_9PROT
MLDRRFVLKALALSMGGLLLPGSMVHAAMSRPRITDVRFSTTPNRTRIIFSLNQEIKHSLATLRDPDRVVLDLQDTELSSDLNLLSFTDPIVRKVRTDSLGNGTMRAVFELQDDASSRAFLLKDKEGGRPRLVVEFTATDTRDEADAGTAQPNRLERPLVARKGKRDIVIVLDPGHGGIDPGAIGAGGVKEKDVALSVARQVAREINATPGYKAFLTRNEDRFVGLSRRCAIARNHKADLFISLHADAFHIPSARGASVYCLSERGRRNPVPANQKSLMLGNTLLSAIASTPSLSLHFKTIKQARFAVLKTQEIPSVLVEMAFLSNRQEEMLLRKSSHQASLAKAVTVGAKNFVQKTGLV